MALIDRRSSCSLAIFTAAVLAACGGKSSPQPPAQRASSIADIAGAACTGEENDPIVLELRDGECICARPLPRNGERSDRPSGATFEGRTVCRADPAAEIDDTLLDQRDCPVVQPRPGTECTAPRLHEDDCWYLDGPQRAILYFRCDGPTWRSLTEDQLLREAAKP